MVIDTGADYTILPGYLATELGIHLARRAEKLETSGIGGREAVWLVRDVKARLGPWERVIPVGFLARNDLPPLIGRYQFLETFEARFRKKRDVIFST